MSNAKSDYLRGAIANAVLRNTPYSSPTTVYVALFTVAPTNSTAGTEVPGGLGYSRQAVAFNTTATPGQVANSVTVTVGPCTTTAWGTVVATAIMDAATNGNMLYFGLLSSTKTVAVGDSVSFNAGELTAAET